MLADTDTIQEFLTRLSHKVAVVARKPVPDRPGDLPDQYVLWPVQLIDPVDQIAWLANFYDAVYVNLNPLLPEWQYKSLPAGKSIKDAMIARRTRILLDIDAHGCELSEVTCSTRDSAPLVIRRLSSLHSSRSSKECWRSSWREYGDQARRNEVGLWGRFKQCRGDVGRLDGNQWRLGF
jgi:hypothetical protein